ncbi:hypothetical protein SZ00_06174 (plasmid) [Rhodococcus sp. AD45]|nr:hypothetical protein SZ00_06174 [Rhodococcus sp. AD45]
MRASQPLQHLPRSPGLHVNSPHDHTREHSERATLGVGDRIGADGSSSTRMPATASNGASRILPPPAGCCLCYASKSSRSMSTPLVSNENAATPPTQQGHLYPPQWQRECPSISPSRCRHGLRGAARCSTTRRDRLQPRDPCGRHESLPGNRYASTTLAASNDSYGAPTTSPEMVNAWGIAIRPQGEGGHFWIGGGGTSFQFVGDVSASPTWRCDRCTRTHCARSPSPAPTPTPPTPAAERPPA